MNKFNIFKQLVKNNNKFKLNLNEIILSNKANSSSIFATSIDELAKTPFENDDIIFFLNAICMLNDVEKLVKLLETIELKKIKFKVTHEFIYYLIREKNHRLLELIIEFSENYLKQNLFTEKLGEYLNAEKNETTLIRAIKSQNLELVKLLIEKCGATVSLADPHGRSPLYIAAGLEKSQIVELLLANGAKVNETCLNGDTPLLRACQIINTSNMQILIDHGGLINFKGYGGNAAVHTVIHTDSNDDNINGITLNHQLKFSKI
jgi:ankyrin repeat protein